jgi:hypothetical protein
LSVVYIPELGYYIMYLHRYSLITRGGGVGSVCAPKSWHYNQLADCDHYQAETDIYISVQVKNVGSLIMSLTHASCGTVALYGLFIKKNFLADHRATDFTLSKIFGTPTKNTSHLSTKRFV